MRGRLVTATAISLAVIAAGCGSSDDNGGGEPAKPSSARLPQGSEPVRLDPADFTTEIDNPYWPMAPGSRWTYREGKSERVVVTVTNRTKRIANGIEARVVHDVVSEDGQVVEDTYDWYAQDRAGNIWYVGEDTKEFENGRVKTTEGSWEAGVDGAQPGVALPADPRPGMKYRQEHYAGHAEDNGEVLSIDESVAVPFGRFDGALKTKDTTPLEPDVVENKLYARGVGPVKTIAVSGGGGDEVLLTFTRGRG